MILVPRSTIWPGVLPTGSTGQIRPVLAPLRPYLTVHYTGGGVWLDPDDSPTELRSIQNYATAAGKPWEYNYVIDGQGIVFEYAGRYQAAHIGTDDDGHDDDNKDAIGVLLLVGLAGPGLSHFEVPTVEMVVAVRDLRAWLVAKGMLAGDHAMLQHRQMPHAATLCPGPEVDKQWQAMTLPVPAPPEDDEMLIARRVRNPRYANIWLVGAGPALHLSGELNESYADVPLIVSDHAQLLETLLYQSGLTDADLVPGVNGCALEIGANLEHLLILIGASMAPVVAAVSGYISHRAGKQTRAAITAGRPPAPVPVPPAPAGWSPDDIRNRTIGE